MTIVNRLYRRPTVNLVDDNSASSSTTITLTAGSQSPKQVHLIAVAAESASVSSDQVVNITSTNTNFDDWHEIDERSTTSGGTVLLLSVFKLKDPENNSLANGEVITVTMAGNDDVVAQLLRVEQCFIQDGSSQFSESFENSTTPQNAASVDLTPNFPYISNVISFLATSGVTTLATTAGLTTADATNGATFSLASATLPNSTDFLPSPHTMSWSISPNDRYVHLAIELPYQSPAIVAYTEGNSEDVDLVLSVDSSAEDGDLLSVHVKSDVALDTPANWTLVQSTGTTYLFEKIRAGETSVAISATSSPPNYLIGGILCNHKGVMPVQRKTVSVAGAGSNSVNMARLSGFLRKDNIYSYVGSNDDAAQLKITGFGIDQIYEYEGFGTVTVSAATHSLDQEDATDAPPFGTKWERVDDGSSPLFQHFTVMYEFVDLGEGSVWATF